MKLKSKNHRRQAFDARMGRRSTAPVVQQLESRVLMASTPFLGTPVALPATIMADNFDNGGQGVAYNDTTPGNWGGSYRSTDVDLEPAGDVTPPGLTATSPGVGFNVGHVAPTEWLNYTTSVTTTGVYAVSVRTASGGPTGTFHINVDGVNGTGSQYLPATGSWTTWQTISAGSVTLSAGQHVLQLSIDSASAAEAGRIEWIQISTVSAGGETPYLGAPVAVPGTVSADNFDNGGQGVAYNDTTPGNQGGSYRSTDVDIEPSSDIPGGYDVGHITAGEWLNYTISASTTGLYPVTVRLANGGPTGTFHLSVDGVNATGSVTFPSTGSWTTWQNVFAGNLPMTAGPHVLQLHFDTGVAKELGNVEWMQIAPGSSTGETPFSSTPVSVPGTIMTGNFDNGGQGAGYNDSTPGNQGGAYRSTDVDIEAATDAVPPGLTTTSPGVGFDVGHITAGEWLNYSITVPTGGAYPVGVRVANAGAAGTFHIEIDGTNMTGAMTLPVTGGWQTYTTVTAPAVVMSSGNHILRLVFDSNSAKVELGNVEWIQIGSVGSMGSGTLNWTAIAPSLEPKEEGSSVVANGKLYAFGGYNSNAFTSDSQAEVYDPTTNAWTQLANMPEPITHAQTVVDGNNIWLIAGFIGTEEDAGSADVWIYNTITNSYTAGPSLPSALGAPAVALLGRNIHVVSGLTEVNGVFVNTTEHWVLNLDNLAAGWTSSGAPMPRPRNHSGTVVFNNQMWVIGGQDVKNEFTGDSAAVDVYNPATNTWSEPGDLPGTRGHLLTSMVVFNGSIYAFGGEGDGSVILSDVVGWNPAVGAWLTIPGFALPAPRMAVNVGVIGNEVIAFGGATPLPVANGWSAQIPNLTPTQSPYLGAPFAVGQTIQADNFDNGGEGLAYHNIEGVNQAGQYRMGGVDIEPNGDIPSPGQTTASPGEPYNIGHIVAGDWLDYAINVATTGTYSLDIRVANGGYGGSFHFESDSVNVTGPIAFPVTGGWQTWSTLTVPTVNLTAGTHELRLVIDSSVAPELGNINWFRLYTPVTPGALIATPAALIATATSVASPTPDQKDELIKKKLHPAIKAHRVELKKPKAHKKS